MNPRTGVKMSRIDAAGAVMIALVTSCSSGATNLGDAVDGDDAGAQGFVNHPTAPRRVWVTGPRWVRVTPPLAPSAVK